MIDLSQARWRKAAKSTGANTGCVEIASNVPGVVAIRDSQSPDQGAHVVTRRAFATFLSDVQNGRYDL